MPGRVHMVCGPVGAGKTTYGRALARDRRACMFAVDQWMATLFMIDAPVPITLDWALPRVNRCEEMIWNVAVPLIERDLDVVVELGFFRRDQRDRFRARAAAAGVALQLHSIGATRDVRRERVRRRNVGSETLTVQVDDAMFDWSEGYYEALGVDELRGAVIVGPEVELR